MRLDAQKKTGIFIEKPWLWRYSGRQWEIDSWFDREEVFLACRAVEFRREAPKKPALHERAGSAAETVGRDPALIQKILEHTDFKTILINGNRVNKTWYLAIFTSPALKEMMFISPMSDMGIKPFGWLGEDGHGTVDNPIINPLLVENFGNIIFKCDSHYGKFHRSESLFTMPWTSDRHELVEYRGNNGGPPGRVRIEDPLARAGARRTTAADLRAKEHRERFTRLGASWRRMVASQPPPPQLGFLIYNHTLPRRLKPDAEGNPRAQQTEHFLLGQLWDRKGNREDTAKEKLNRARMGGIYDAVLFLGGHSYKHSRFWRVLWGKPEAPLLSGCVRRKRDTILKRAGFIIELHDEEHLFQHRDLGMSPFCIGSNNTRYPDVKYDTENFLRTFRCLGAPDQVLRNSEIAHRQTVTIGNNGKGLDKAAGHCILPSTYPCQASIGVPNPCKRTAWDDLYDRLEREGNVRPMRKCKGAGDPDE